MSAIGATAILTELYVIEPWHRSIERSAAQVRKRADEVQRMIEESTSRLDSQARQLSLSLERMQRQFSELQMARDTSFEVARQATLELQARVQELHNKLSELEQENVQKRPVTGGIPNE